MNRWLLLALIACCALAFAQQPEPGKGEDAPPEAAEVATGAAGADTEKDPVADTGEDTAPDAEADTAAVEPGEVDGEPDGEFKPSEEIPEDYPVPLPSDI